MNKIFIFFGRKDGIGNRIEQLINLQYFCITNNCKAVYLWNNNNNNFNRCYDILINFNQIYILYLDELSKLNDILVNNNLKTKILHKLDSKISNDFSPLYNFKFNFDINKINNINNYNYDLIVHLRTTDRINNKKAETNNDFYTTSQLQLFVDKTIEFINNSENIKLYTIVGDDNNIKNYIINNTNKSFVSLCYNTNLISKRYGTRAWLDYYYLTKTKKYILMCSIFSSYSITASILANKQLLIFKESINSNISRYNCNYKII